MIGEKYSDCENWKHFIPIKKNMKYLEIGVYYGHNFISVLNTYCKDLNSELHAIDPWCNKHYNFYSHLTNKGDFIYNSFLKNLNNSGGKDKTHVHRGFSYKEILNLHDNYFDMIYIDGCHEPESVMEDTVLSFRKLKNDGYIIFDDYLWSDQTRKSIDSFIDAFGKRVKKIGVDRGQVFIQKIINETTPAISFNN